MAGISHFALGKAAALAAFIIGLLVILGAWGSQIWGGLVPCELCLGERLPYYWGLPLLAVILLLWDRLPRTVWTIGLLIVAAIFVWSIYLGAYHAGVEWKFWAGPSACTSESGGLDLSQLSNLNAVKSVPCDVVQWRDPVLKTQPRRLQRPAVAGHRRAAAGGAGQRAAGQCENGSCGLAACKHGLVVPSAVYDPQHFDPSANAIEDEKPPMHSAPDAHANLIGVRKSFGPPRQFEASVLHSLTIFSASKGLSSAMQSPISRRSATAGAVMTTITSLARRPWPDTLHGVQQIPPPQAERRRDPLPRSPRQSSP